MAERIEQNAQRDGKTKKVPWSAWAAGFKIPVPLFQTGFSSGTIGFCKWRRRMR